MLGVYAGKNGRNLIKEGDKVSETDISEMEETAKDEDIYSCLKLENQLCFPLYACSKEVIRKYKPLLDRLDLTYTQ